MILKNFLKKLLKRKGNNEIYYVFFNLEKNNLTGNKILKIAYELLLEIRQKIRVKFIWIECQNNEKILNFYQNFGFSKIDNFISQSGYNVMIMELK